MHFNTVIRNECDLLQFDKPRHNINNPESILPHQEYPIRPFSPYRLPTRRRRRRGRVTDNGFYLTVPTLSTVLLIAQDQ